MSKTELAFTDENRNRSGPMESKNDLSFTDENESDEVISGLMNIELNLECQLLSISVLPERTECVHADIGCKEIENEMHLECSRCEMRAVALRTYMPDAETDSRIIYEENFVINARVINRLKKLVETCSKKQ
jgi:hypothetical protein